MEHHPLQQEPLRVTINAFLSAHNQWRADLYSGKAPSVRGMNVWWIVVEVEHRNDDPTKA